MAGYDIGDQVVYPPHGAGTVEAKETRDDAFGEYLSIRIAHSKMTLMVPAATAADKGVRPVVSAKAADALLKGLMGDSEELAESPQLRARQAADTTRAGDATGLANALRDYMGRQRNGAKLSAVEKKAIETMKLILSSEIAMAKGMELSEAAAKLDKALEAAAAVPE